MSSSGQVGPRGTRGLPEQIQHKSLNNVWVLSHSRLDYLFFTGS